MMDGIVLLSIDLEVFDPLLLIILRSDNGIREDPEKSCFSKGIIMGLHI